MVQETVRQPERATKDRRLVQELQDLVSKAVRCLYTEEFLREVSHAELTKKLTVQANAFSAKAAEKIEALGGKAEVI